MNPQRRGLIARVHIAKKSLNLDDANYRSVLQRVTGKDSSKDLNIGQLEAVIDEFKRLGFVSEPPKRTKVKTLISKPQVKKIRALWLSLWNLGVIHDSSEKALEAFVKRVAGVNKLQWLTPVKADRVMKALYGWLEREGWFQPSGRDEAAMRTALISAQLLKLGVTFEEWTGGEHIYHWSLSVTDMDIVIMKLGHQIRNGKRGYND